LTPLDAWESFYVIIGSSAAALTGLQFVVIVLAAEMHALTISTIRAYATPTIIHFCAVLLISAILSAPWSDISYPSFGLAMCGLAGFAYALIVIRRARSQTFYVPVLEDWIWHGVLPLIAYAVLVIAAILLVWNLQSSLFVIGGMAALLLFVGIHNAWDAVTYIALEFKQPQEPTNQDSARKA
jgi:hypothetical protein